MKVDVVEAVPGDGLDEVWRLYAQALDELRFTAVQRQVMHRHEFDALMADRRVDKYLAVDDGGELRGLSTYTNELAAVPLISPEYFARRWPEHYTGQRIWYCGFVAIAPGAHNTGAFASLVEAMYRVVEADQGVIAINFCRHNDEVHRMSRAVRLMLHRLSANVRSHRMDEQSYWLYEFPTD